MSPSVLERSARLLRGGRAGEAAGASGRRIGANIGLGLVARVVTTLGSLVTVPLLARALGVGDFGVWTAALAFVGLFSTVTELGLTNAATLRMAGDPEREAEWLGAISALRTLLSLVAVGLCAGSVPFLLEGDRPQEVALILTGTILTSGAASLMSVFQSRLRGGIVLVLTIAQSVTWVGAVIALTVGHGTVVAFAIAYLGMTLLVAVAQVAVTRRLARIAWRAGRELWSPLIRLALPLGIASVLIVIYYRVDAVLLLRLAGPREAGVYGAAYRLLDPLTAVPAAIMGSFFPVLSAISTADRERLLRLVQVAADVMGVVALPAVAVTLVLSGPIIDLLYGPGFERAAGLLPILMLAFASICFGSLAGFLAPLLNLQWRLAGFSALGAAANVVLNLALIPSYGAYGSAWATVVTEILTTVLLLGTGLRALRLRLSLARLVRILLAAGITTAATAALAPLGLVPALAGAVITYPAGLLALRAISPAELRDLRTQA